MLDAATIRARTPGCATAIHLDSAGSGLPDQRVLDAITGHLQREAQVGGYRAAAEVEPRRQAVRDSLARLLGVEPHEVALAENASRAWHLVAHALLRDLRAGDRVLVGPAEYVSNLLELRRSVEARGGTVHLLPVEADRRLDPESLRVELARGDVRLVALTHVASSNGTIQPAAEVGRITRDAGVTFLLDACQSVGQLAVDARRIGADAVTGTSRKFLRGPRGLGFLALRDPWLTRVEAPYAELGSGTWELDGSFRAYPDARRFETWERSIALELGLGAAVDVALELEPGATERTLLATAGALRGGLAGLPAITVHDGTPAGAIVTFTHAARSADEVVDRLREVGITVSRILASSARHDLGERGLDAVVRASVHVHTTEAEVERTIAAVATLGG